MIKVSGKTILTTAAILALTITGFAAAKLMSVQVQKAQLRETPSFLGKIVGDLAYGERVQVLEEQGSWIKISGGNASGWIHSSALTTKKLALQAGSANAQTAASSDELALAGKGFNSDVEADFKKKHKDIDFSGIDKMESIRISSSEIIAFLKEGNVSTKGGAQ